MRPYAAQRAAGQAPAPTLTLAESAVLCRLRDGEAIIVGGQDLPLSIAVRLAAIGRIQISDGHAVAFNPEELPF